MALTVARISQTEEEGVPAVGTLGTERKHAGQKKNRSDFSKMGDQESANISGSTYIALLPKKSPPQIRTGMKVAMSMWSLRM